MAKYFDSVDHDILIRLIRKKISDEKVLRLVEEIIASHHGNVGVGIPIGNLTSQLFANIYMNELDQFVKHTVRAKYYIRYMDDFVILDYDKKKLAGVKEMVREFLHTELHLRLHPKKAEIFPVQGGIDFLGYVVFEKYLHLRKSSVRRFIVRTRRHQWLVRHEKMTLEQFYNSVRSWNAYAEFGETWRLRSDLQLQIKRY